MQGGRASGRRSRIRLLRIVWVRRVVLLIRWARVGVDLEMEIGGEGEGCIVDSVQSNPERSEQR